MNSSPTIRFAAESPRHRLLRVLQPDYLLALLRSRSRWVLAGITLCASLGIHWGLESPTYQAQVVIEDEELCPHGLLVDTFGLPIGTDGQICSQCKPKDAK